jgi:hypothetical protein
MAEHISKRRLAAAVIIQRLRQGRGKADSPALVAALGKHHLRPEYLGIGVREVRDLYGDNALVVVLRGPIESPLYVLDPKRYAEARDWARKMFRRSLTELSHVVQILDWSVQHGIAPAAAKRAKRYAENARAEVEDVLSTITEA